MYLSRISFHCFYIRHISNCFPFRPPSRAGDDLVDSDGGGGGPALTPALCRSQKADVTTSKPMEKVKAPRKMEETKMEFRLKKVL